MTYQAASPSQSLIGVLHMEALKAMRAGMSIDTIIASLNYTSDLLQHAQPFVQAATEREKAPC